MEYYNTLHDLLKHSKNSKSIYDALHTDEQIALQEQRQNIHTYADLQKAISGIVKRECRR
jgi:hypothetical protein